MRRFIPILFLFILLPEPAANCQLVTTEPTVPLAGGSLKIFYNSSRDQGDLHNFTGDLYVHTGLTVDGANWQNVIGTWGNNTSQPKLKYLGDYRYELDITPDIKTFYGNSGGEITKIGLVFRNAQGNLQTRPDIFIDVFQAGLNVSITYPGRFSMVVDPGSEISVSAAATLADSLTLYINNRFLKSGVTADLVTAKIAASQPGEFWVKAVAWDQPAFVADSFFVYVRKPVVIEALPGGVDDGINYTGSNSVTLVLHAPYKNFVFATGDFTGWLACEKGYMKKTPDGERYWVEINDLESGREYRFQYLVDTTIYIADPYSEKVLDPWNDGYIDPETYPDLIPYPKDTASGIVSVLQTNMVPYSWKTAGFIPPEKQNLVIYELLIRDFTAKHDFRTMIDTLSYLDDLGVNAIELMPVSEFEGNLSWGYNPSFYFAPDKYYGPQNDLKAFIDSCHTRGIAVFMDIVLNHTMGQSPLVQLYLDRYGTDQIFMKTPNPWFNASSPNPVFKWGADFNHESIYTQALIDRINAFWLTEYRIDGFRFDFTKGFTNTPGDGGSYDASRIALLKRMADKIWSVNPDAVIILEHFAPDAEEKELAAYGMMLWNNKNYEYSEAAMGYSSDLTNASYLGRGWTLPHLVTYIESHDEERVMYKTLTWGNSSGNYNTQNQNIALKRMQMNALFFLMIPGPKMIWQFGELGYDVSIDEGGRTGEKPVRWDYYSNEDRKKLFLTYKFLINLRMEQPVFRTSNFTWSLGGSTKSLQLIDQTMKVNILGNFGVTASGIDPAFPGEGKWYEYFTGDSVTITGTGGMITLKPGEYRLYTTTKLEPSELITGTDDNIPGADEQKMTVYPNPFETETLITLSGDNILRSCTIEIYSAYGIPIWTITIPAGTTRVTWDGKTTSGAIAGKGLYIIRVKSEKGYGLAKVIRN